MTRFYHRLIWTFQILRYGHIWGRKHAIHEVWAKRLLFSKQWYKWEPVGPVRSNDKGYSIQRMRRKS